MASPARSLPTLCSCRGWSLDRLSDVPQVLDPLEIKHSQDGVPYASRTRIGWAVNGPLGRHRHYSQASEFFAKADIQLQRMVEEFYNQDFTDSIVNNKTERHFMQSAEKSVEFRNGHHEISLPFKNRQTPVPNNISQAVQCINWLKRKIEREPRLLKDYKAFMEDIMSKGYAHKVLHGLEKGRAWYIPHHRVYHPHKSGKIRVDY